MSAVPAAHAWPTNADLIADVARLGYLDGVVVDATYGRGGFWRRWQPETLIAHDLRTVDHVDLRHLPERDASVDVVVLDPPYRLNGTPDRGDFDTRYGTTTIASADERAGLYFVGISEAKRVLRPGGRLLVKTQDQVVSGHVRWLTIECINHAACEGFDLVDRFDMLRRGRSQPPGRRQVHARGRPSTLLVFRREATL